MPTNSVSAALGFDDIVTYVDEVLSFVWSRRDFEATYRMAWVRTLPKRPGYSWLEEAWIVVDDNVLRLDLGDGTAVRVTNPTPAMVAQFVDIFEALVAERVAAREAEAAGR